MPKVIFVDHLGTRYEEEVESGLSVMQAAVHNDVPGILAECGGAAACSTCRVVVDDAWNAKVPPISATETSMLSDETIPFRLSCQIHMTDELDGLVVHVPESQY